jgi:hypothetical protein
MMQKELTQEEKDQLSLEEFFEYLKKKFPGVKKVIMIKEIEKDNVTYKIREKVDI